jgi:hypothetical protein
VTPEIRQQFHAVFDAHSESIRALRAAQQHMSAAVRAFGDAIQAHDEAIAGALAANQAAIELLNLME